MSCLRARTDISLISSNEDRTFDTEIRPFGPVEL